LIALSGALVPQIYYFERSQMSPSYAEHSIDVALLRHLVVLDDHVYQCLRIAAL
jgi:hypothetical protein